VSWGGGRGGEGKSNATGSQSSDSSTLVQDVQDVLCTRDGLCGRWKPMAAVCSETACKDAWVSLVECDFVGSGVSCSTREKEVTSTGEWDRGMVCQRLAVGGGSGRVVRRLMATRRAFGAVCW
jgi:hypothetical protein